MSVFKELILKILYPNKYNSNAMIKYIRKGKGSVGHGTIFFDPYNTRIDPNRRSYIKIGDYCKITSGVKFLCHDYSWTVLRRYGGMILPDPGGVIAMGNNVFVGWDSTIMGPCNIGDNVIIGANSFVKGKIPSNQVWAGNPAKYICDIGEYLVKKQNFAKRNAIERARHVIAINGSVSPQDMGWFQCFFMDRNVENEKKLRRLPSKGDEIDEMINSFYESTPIWRGFDEFLNEVMENE